MDALDLLVSDHNRVPGLFHQDIPGRSTMSTDELRATVSPS